MGFMQKNVNAFLLILLLLIAGAIAASSVYYQKNFDSLTDKQDKTTTNLTECRADLEAYRVNLNKTMTSLNTTTQDIRRYDELYATKAEQLQTTQTDLEKTSQDLQSIKVSLQEETALKNRYKQDYEDTLQQKRAIEEQNTILTAQKADLEKSVISYRNKVDAAEMCIGSFLEDYDAGLTQAMKDDIADCSP